MVNTNINFISLIEDIITQGLDTILEGLISYNIKYRE